MKIKAGDIVKIKKDIGADSNLVGCLGIHLDNEFEGRVVEKNGKILTMEGGGYALHRSREVRHRG